MTAHVEPDRTESERLDRIEAKLDKLIATLGEPFTLGIDPEASIALVVEDISCTLDVVDFQLGRLLGCQKDGAA